MGKTLNREQRKNSKYINRDVERELKSLYELNNFNSSEQKKEKPKKKWRPHSEIIVD